MMIRRSKTIVLAILAVAALSAVASPGAQAAKKFTALEGGTHVNASVKGLQTSTQIFATSPGTQIGCETAVVEGDITGGEAETLRVFPEYTKCALQKANDSTMTMNGCEFTLTEPAATGTENVSEGPADLFCPSGHAIEIHIYTSEAHITLLCTVTAYVDETSVETGNEDKYSSVKYTSNEKANPKDVDVSWNLSGITFEEHGALCPDGNTVKRHTATFKGSVTLEAFSEKNAKQIDATVD